MEQLCRQIRANGAVPILFATWAYQKGGAKPADKGWDYDEMFQKLSEAYHKAAQENNALIADVGRRFYELSDTQDLYAADSIHPSELGSRIAAGDHRGSDPAARKGGAVVCQTPQSRPWRNP